MQRHAFFLTLVLLGLLSACGRSAPTAFYLLESSLAPATADSLPATRLRVAQVTVPEYLDRNGIVSRVDGKTQLVVAQFHSWAEPVRQGVRRVTQEVLTPPLLAAGVTVLAPGDDSRSEYTLVLDVQRLDGNFHAQAVLEARWSLRDRDDKVLAQGIYADTEQVRGASYDDLTAAESVLVRRMGEHLAQRLPSHMRRGG